MKTKSRGSGTDAPRKVFIAVYVSGGIVQDVIANIPTSDFEVEIVDADNEPTSAAGKRWEELKRSGLS